MNCFITDEYVCSHVAHCGAKFPSSISEIMLPCRCVKAILLASIGGGKSIMDGSGKSKLSIFDLREVSALIFSDKLSDCIALTKRFMVHGREEEVQFLSTFI